MSDLPTIALSALPLITDPRGQKAVLGASLLIALDDLTGPEANIPLNAFIGTTVVITAPALAPIVEGENTISLGGPKSNATTKSSTSITGASTAGTPATGYINASDLTPNYTFLYNESGHNESLSTNDGRTGIFANRAKIVHNGQGDLYAYVASVRVMSAPLPGVTNWIASPAGVMFAGTIIAEVDGIYLNPREIHLTDKPHSIAYNVTGIGDVVNMNRNAPSGVALGQVWVGYRAQSEGVAYVDAILDATGKFFSGIDLSMASLDFGTNKAAIALKANDRIYFNASAAQINDGTTFIRADWRATGGFDDYVTYETSGVARIKFVTNNAEALNISDTAVNAVIQFNAQKGVFISNTFKLNVNGQGVVGNRIGGWSPDTGTAKRTANATYAGTAEVSYTQATIQALMDAVQGATQTIMALKADLNITSGGHGLIGP